MFDTKGQLTREGAELAIKNGGSVLVGGQAITRIEDLPTTAQFAKSPEARTAARKELEGRQAQIDADIARLDKADAAGDDAGSDVVADDDGLDAMTKAELKTVAGDEGVDIGPQASKEQLVEAIRKHRST